jgi:hypothetical protein
VYFIDGERNILPKTCFRWHLPSGQPSSGTMTSQKRRMTRPQKITLGEMRPSGVRGLLIYCADYKCSHHIAISADPWPDETRLSDIEDRFTCTA